MFSNAGHSDNDYCSHKRLSGLVIRHLTVDFFVPVRVNAPVSGSWPRKSYSAQLFQSPEQMKS